MAQEQATPFSYKCVLIGDGATGKTSFLRRHLTGEYIPNYNPTVGVDVHNLQFCTNRGPIMFNVWDTAGQEKFVGLKDGYYVQAHCAIIMFDVTSNVTFSNAVNWYKDLVQVCKNIPTVLCGNKGDSRDKREKSTYSYLRSHKMKKLQYFEISVKTNYNLKTPFLWIIRKLIGDMDLELIRLPKLSIVQNFSTGKCMDNKLTTENGTERNLTEENTANVSEDSALTDDGHSKDDA